MNGLPAVADVELAVARQRALVDAEDAHLADVRVLRDLEDVRQHVQRRVGQRGERHRLGAFALEELRRVGLARVGQQLDDHVEQFGDAGAVARRDEADRDQVPFAQRLLERRVQLGRVDVALFEVALDEARVDLDDLLDERAVRLRHRREVDLVARVARVEEAVDDALAAVGGQVQRQALLAERGLDLRHQGREVDVLRVDLVDDDHAAALALRRVAHHPLGHHLDAGRCADHHRGRLDGLQRGQRLAEEVGRARRVDQVDAGVGVSRCISAVFSECCARRSSGSKSLTVEPRSRLPGAPMAPAWHSSASARLVLPAAAGPTRARVRMLVVPFGRGLGMGNPYGLCGSATMIARLDAAPAARSRGSCASARSRSGARQGQKGNRACGRDP